MSLNRRLYCGRCGLVLGDAYLHLGMCRLHSFLESSGRVKVGLLFCHEVVVQPFTLRSRRVYRHSVRLSMVSIRPTISISLLNMCTVITFDREVSISRVGNPYECLTYYY